MTAPSQADAKAWFDAFSRFNKQRSLRTVRALLSPQVLDLQDDSGMTAVHLAIANDWMQAVDVLIEAKANLELWHYRTGDTPLYTAVLERKPHLISALLDAGANPDAANHKCGTPRLAAAAFGSAELFAKVPERPIVRLPPQIQNAEVLAEHYHPQFKIPSRAERDALVPGAAVDVHVFGPKPPHVKCRIVERAVTPEGIRYLARVETPESNLPADVETVTFGPEHVATVWLKRPG